MNKIELMEWIKSAKNVGTESFEYDQSCNAICSEIFSKDGKLYRISSLNGHPDPVFGPKGWIKDTYEPQEVIEVKLEITEYETVKPKSDLIDSYRPADRCCSCHINPPCSYCTDGGYCKEHNSMRIDCGCELT